MELFALATPNNRLRRSAKTRHNNVRKTLAHDIIRLFLLGATFGYLDLSDEEK